MTVTYTSSVADCKGFGCFWKLLFRWRGSIYKLVWPDLLAYSFFYFLLSAIYRYVLTEEGKRLFEKISLYTNSFTELIPISFVLGFYVSIVVQRWWAQYECLPWPDSLSLYISTSIPGNDDKGRRMRRTIVRYANLAFTLTLIMISPKIKKRFPTHDHLIEAGLLTANEKKIFDDMTSKTAHPVYWMPLVWAGTVVARARKEMRIRDDFAVKTIIDEINRLRGLCGSLLNYDWISIPLVYTQVVTLAVYAFFLSTLMGRQFLDPNMNYDKHNIDLVFPIFTYLQFFFYMGWLKVAESLVNPFGEDDDDFEINWLIDRNLQVSYLIVDEMHNEHPELIQDIYWDEVFPTELPYTIASQEFRTEPPQGSTANIDIPEDEQELLPINEEGNVENGLSGMKRIGSNVSNMLYPHSGLLKKNSVLSFIQRSASSIKKSSKKKSLITSKSSTVTLNPGTANTTQNTTNQQLSDISLSGSESFSPQLHSSRESLHDDPSLHRHHMLLRRMSSQDDDGIHFNIKKKDDEESATDKGPKNPIVTLNFESSQGYHPRPSSMYNKGRTTSMTSHNSCTDFELPKPSEDNEGKLLKLLRPPTPRNVSSTSLKEHFGRKGQHPNSFRKLTRPSSFNVPNRPHEFQSRRSKPRGPLLRGLSSTLEQEEPNHYQHNISTSYSPPLPPSSTSPLYVPLTMRPLNPLINVHRGESEVDSPEIDNNLRESRSLSSAKEIKDGTNCSTAVQTDVPVNAIKELDIGTDIKEINVKTEELVDFAQKAENERITEKYELDNTDKDANTTIWL